ncbi:MAG TPA: DUF1398 family protein [Parvibaculum sp.]
MDERLIKSAHGLSFPDAVARLTEAGVVRYTVDLIRCERTLYGLDDETLQDDVAVDTKLEVSPHFTEATLRSALAAVQAGQIDYAAFLAQIMAAGVASYAVFIRGRKVVYTGRNGDALTEPFPGGK